MPELPEVETLVQQLKKRVLNKTITKIEVFDSKVVDSRIKKITPFKITKVYRRAKSIVIELSKNQTLLVHLRMTGHFHYAKNESKLEPYNKFAVAKFYLKDGSLLTHNSVRKFGHLKLVTKEQLEKELSKLGPEPLVKEFTSQKFAEMLEKKKKSNIKTLLLDQKFLAGVGNIYAQEALYHAKIDPQRKVGSLSPEEVKKLHQKIKHVLNSAVKHHGTTVETYVHIEGTGGFQKHLAVYQRQKCPKGHSLKKIGLGGRGTYYCPKCQK